MRSVGRYGCPRLLAAATNLRLDATGYSTYYRERVRGAALAHGPDDQGQSQGGGDGERDRRGRQDRRDHAEAEEALNLTRQHHADGYSKADGKARGELPGQV